jgi:hydroxypyruvate reductase
VRAAIDAADTGRLVQHSLSNPAIVALLHRALAVDVVAVGKAAAPMAAAFGATAAVPIRTTMTVGVHDAGHPVPDQRSVAAARNALDIAAGASEPDVMVVLLSGGASALMALPAEGLTLEDKQRTVRLLLAGGADITELNTVRKHLSSIKGGRLAAACAGTTLTLAVSDVVGDDLSVIGSGPTSPDPSTWQMALDVLDRRGGLLSYPAAAIHVLERGAASHLADTPKAGDARLARSRAHVIGGRRDALDGARQAARSLGYHVHVMTDPVVGIARDAALEHAASVARLVQTLPRPACILSAGETTVHVTGGGTGGRNQEFALAMARPLGSMNAAVAAASVGTDGIDGPTDAAGAIVDRTTLERAAAAAIEPDVYLNDNNSYVFFGTLNDLIRIGPTHTNVGDLQVVLVGE